MGSFVSGHHRYLLPVTPDGGVDGRGRCGRHWPGTHEVPVDRLRDSDVDVVVLQRPEELELTQRWLGRRPGLDVPAIYVEHNAPRPYAATSVHPLSERSDIPVVHVTDFNRLMWDNGRAPTVVVNHGLADPGSLYVGDIPAAATMINEPVRRWRVVGADLLGQLGVVVPIDVWGIGTTELNETPHRRAGVTGLGDLPTDRLLPEVARRRVYLHTPRWTSLGLSLAEAMLLGMPVVAVASTMAPLVVPEEAGVVSADVATLGRALANLLADKAAAEIAGKAARSFALTYFSLDRFLSQWDDIIESLCA